MMLKGSEKQVEWATKIRKQLISKWERYPLFDMNKKHILRQSSASWWISIYKNNKSLVDICPKTKPEEKIVTLDDFFS